VEEGAADDDGNTEHAVAALGYETEVGEEEGKLKAQDAHDVKGSVGVLELV